MILFKLIAFIFIVGIIAIIAMGVGLWVRVRSAIDRYVAATPSAPTARPTTAEATA